MLKRSTWNHSFPAWIAGPRSLHPKFGGGVIRGGIVLVTNRLQVIKENFPKDLSSGHVFHEVRVSPDGYTRPYFQFNNESAVPFNWFIEGIAAGHYPHWSAMTAPAFGLGIRDGMILNPDPKFIEMAKAAHWQAMEWSRELKGAGLGRGFNIWWPAFDSRLAFGPLSVIGHDEAIRRLENFWVDLFLQLKTDDTICLEYKPSVPGRLDFIPTMKAAIAFCQQVNDRVGRKAMTVNLEWAHALIGGQTVAEATQMQVESGMFSGLVHVNSAERAMVRWDFSGSFVLEGTPGDDADWPVGYGGPERYNDQLEAVRILDQLGMDIIAEHDIDPAGADPIQFYAMSRECLEDMIATVREEDRVETEKLPI